MAKLRVSLLDNSSIESKKRIGIEERQYIFPDENIYMMIQQDITSNKQIQASPIISSDKLKMVAKPSNDSIFYTRRVSYPVKSRKETSFDVSNIYQQHRM